MPSRIMQSPRALYQGFLPAGEHAFVWKYSRTFGGCRPRHFHSEPEINLVVKGAAAFGIAGRTVHVSAGEMVAFPAGQDHCLLAGSQDLYLYALGLDSSFSAQVLGVEGEPVTPMHVKLAPNELDLVLDRAASIVDRSGAGQLGAELWQRVHWLGKKCTPQAGYGTHVLTRRALKLMSTSPALGLEELGLQLRAHPSEVSRHLCRDLGMTLVRYRTRLRLLKFIEQVDSRQTDMLASANAAGFGSYSQCHRMFHAELGCAPGEFFSGVREQMQLSFDPEPGIPVSP